MEINQWVDELFEVLLQDKGLRMCESIFNRFDTNHSNSISKEELKVMVIELAL